jgi:hypothetical protein
MAPPSSSRTAALTDRQAGGRAGRLCTGEWLPRRHAACHASCRLLPALTGQRSLTHLGSATLAVRRRTGTAAAAGCTCSKQSTQPRARSSARATLSTGGAQLQCHPAERAQCDRPPLSRAEGDAGVGAEGCTHGHGQPQHVAGQAGRQGMCHVSQPASQGSRGSRAAGRAASRARTPGRRGAAPAPPTRRRCSPGGSAR